MNSGTRGVVLLAICCFAVSACGPVSTRPEASAGSILDRSLSDAQRLRAVQEVPLRGDNPAGAIAALNVLVWSDRHPIGLRIAAMDRLIRYDGSAFWRAADRWLPRVDEPAMLRTIGRRAMPDPSVEVTSALLWRWAKPSPSLAEIDRVEYDIFASWVSPVPVEQALWDLLSPPTSLTPAPGRVPVSWSAWTVLSRLEDDAVLRSRLAEMRVDSELIQALQAAAAVVDRLPANAEGLRGLMALRRDAPRWRALQGLRDSLADRGGAGVALRHWPALSRLGVDDRAKSYQRGQAEIAAYQATAYRLPRDMPAGMAIRFRADPHGDGQSGSYSDQLSWADLAVIQTILRATRDPAIMAAWFIQADADLIDRTTEYGGVLTWDRDGSFVARLYPPPRREGDRKFFSSPGLVEAMVTGLAHYHFHAQRHDNAEFAGPGVGDLAFTDAMEAHTLTLTFIDHDRLNIDLAFPGGLVLDLGCIDRPAASKPGRAR